MKTMLPQNNPLRDKVVVISPAISTYIYAQ